MLIVQPVQMVMGTVTGNQRLMNVLFRVQVVVAADLVLGALWDLKFLQNLVRWQQKGSQLDYLHNIGVMVDLGL
jgi:hypothetical protein